MKKIFNIQNRIVARADKTMDEATVIIELSDHMWTVALVRADGYRSSLPVARPADVEPRMPL
jgi:hypothetical protein